MRMYLPLLLWCDFDIQYSFSVGVICVCVWCVVKANTRMIWHIISFSIIVYFAHWRHNPIKSPFVWRTNNPIYILYVDSFISFNTNKNQTKVLRTKQQKLVIIQCIGNIWKAISICKLNYLWELYIMCIDDWLQRSNMGNIIV